MRGIVLLCLLGYTMAQYSWSGPGQVEDTDPNTANLCITDTASCGCCLMQKNLMRMESFFNLTINDLQRELARAQAMLNNVRASRSAFSVALTKSRRCVGNLRSDVVLMYESVFINLGDGYNMTTGVFTVPRSGVYSLALTIYSDSGSAGAPLAACGSLRVNGQPVASAHEMNNEDQEDSATVVLALQLSAGDMVDVLLPAGCFLCDDSSHYNTFTGFLLYATD